jgi:hypothetical protein
MAAPKEVHLSDDLSYFRGRADERRRASAILLDPAAIGRESQAIALAVGSTLSVGAALLTLNEISAIDAERAAEFASNSRPQDLPSLKPSPHGQAPSQPRISQNGKASRRCLRI